MNGKKRKPLYDVSRTLSDVATGKAKLISLSRTER